MKLIEADADKLVVELTKADWRAITGIISIISAMQKPDFEDSGPNPITVEDFERTSRAWDALTDGPAVQAFFGGKLR
jgi:hypothetical protein